MISEHEKNSLCAEKVDPSKPYDASKQNFTSVKNDLIPYTQLVLWDCFNNNDFF